MTLTRDPHEAAELILHDFRRPGVLPDLTAVVARPPFEEPAFTGRKGPMPRSPFPPPPGFREDDEVVILCSEQAKFWTGAHIKDLLPQNPLLLRLADAAHLAVLEDRWGGVFPACPAHAAHPLSPQLREDGVFWECPEGEIDPIPLGSLPDHFN